MKTDKKCMDCGISVSDIKTLRCLKCSKIERGNRNKCSDCGKKIRGKKSKRCLDCYTKHVEIVTICKYCSKRLTNNKSETCYKCFVDIVVKTEEYKEAKSKESIEVWSRPEHLEAAKKRGRERWADPEKRRKILKLDDKNHGYISSKLQDKYEEIFFEYGFLKNVRVGNYYPDYCNKARKILVEINGDYWHCNPKLGWEATDIHPHNKKLVSEIWKYDEKKIKEYKSLNYTPIVIWEKELKKLDVRKMLENSGLQSNIKDEFKGKPREEIVKYLEENSFDYAICLDNLNYNINIGACIRNANAFAAKEIFYIGSKKVDTRSAVGTNHYMKITHLPTVDDLIKYKNKYRLVAIENVDSNKTQNLFKYKWAPNSLMIFGSESHGVDQSLIEAADDIVRIPDFGAVRCLNVACAASTIMYSYTSQHDKNR